MSPMMIFLCVAMVLAAVWAVTAGDLLMSAIALALTSAVLACIIYAMGMPLAAVFELSVCAGLITVVFVSAISLTRADSEHSPEKKAQVRMSRRLGGVWLALIMLAVVAGFYFLPKSTILPLQNADNETVTRVMWDLRRFDLVGQIAAILTGIFGVVVLFKARETRGAKGGEEAKR